MAEPKPYPEDSSQKLLYKIAMLFRRSGIAAAEQSRSRVVTNGATDALAARAGRASGWIQNCGTNVLYVKEGPGCSTSDYSAILVGGSANDDARGGTHNIGSYDGIITVAGTSPRYVATERYTPDV